MKLFACENPGLKPSHRDFAKRMFLWVGEARLVQAGRENSSHSSIRKGSRQTSRANAWSWDCLQHSYSHSTCSNVPEVKRKVEQTKSNMCHQVKKRNYVAVRKSTQEQVGFWNGRGESWWAPSPEKPF